MHELTGYADRWSVRQGETIRFMVSSAGGKDFALRFVRHLCSDPNPAGPGYAELPMPSAVDGVFGGKEQTACLGSFGHVASLPVDLRDGVRLSATLWPTTPRQGRQGVLALRIGGWMFALCIGPNGGAMAEVVDADGICVRAEVPRRLLGRRWYDVSAVLNLDGGFSVAQVPHAPLGDAGDAAGTAAPPPAGMPEVFVAALPPEGSGRAGCHYNGKLERPAVHRPPPSNAVLAAWDFAIGISTQSATDTGPHAAHARLINLPTRAMTGSDWTGTTHDWKAAPAQYGAIHFHDDDRGPLGWDESARLGVPADWPSGFYAAHISNAAGEDYIPFVVRPHHPQADVVLVVPTFSYQVYGCFVRPGRGAEIAERASAWGALLETPDMNPQFGLSCYNSHSDGSGVSLVTQLRPMLAQGPRAGCPTTISISSSPPSASRMTSSPTMTCTPKGLPRWRRIALSSPHNIPNTTRNG
jgi:N,N-dimethylformamidase